MPGRRTNQDFYTTDPQPVIGIRDNVRNHFNRFCRNQRVAFNYLVRYYSRKGKVYVSQGRWASACGISIRQLQRYIEQWHADGLIYSNYRHMMTNQYKVSSFLLSSENRQLLKSIIFSFGIFPISMILSSGSSVSENVVQTRNKYIYLHQSNQINSKLKTTGERARACARYSDLNMKCKAVNGMRNEAMIQPYVNEISNPLMTESEKRVLSRYSYEAVMHALKCLQRERDVRNPVGFLVRYAQNYKPVTSPKSKESGPRDPIYTKYTPKELRDAEFWKKDNERYAHWDMVKYGPQLDNLKRIGLDSLSDIFVEKLRVAHAEHQEAACHLCIEHGPQYKVVPTLSERQLKDNEKWERNKYEANEQNKDVRNYTPYPLGTVAPRYVPISDSDAASCDAPDVIPPQPPRGTSPRQMNTIMAGLFPAPSATSQTNTTQSKFKLEENNWPVEYCGEPEDEIISPV